MEQSFDAIIIGSGSNGIAAAINLQKRGLSTAIFELSSTPGGAAKTQELTLPGFKHDVGASILPMGLASPFLSSLPLQDFGLEWIHPEVAYAHPFLDGTAYACYQDLERTVSQLDEDEMAYKKLFQPLLNDWNKIDKDLFGPLTFPSHPISFMNFGLKALRSAKGLSEKLFKNERTKAFFYGSAAHSALPLRHLASASFGLVLTLSAHKYNWPFPKGGTENFIKALLGYYKSLGGVLTLNTKIENIEELPQAEAYLFDVTPKQLLKIKGLKFPDGYRKRLKAYKYGAGVFKIDWALKEPIPFKSQKCQKAGTIHIGFTPQEIEFSEREIYKGRVSSKPYVLVTQHSPFDGSRTPEGKHTAGAYIHVPNGSLENYTEIIENQMERAAPGFRETILARSVMNTNDLERFDPNLIGGDINGGKQDITQLFTRPVMSMSPYSTPNKNVYLCSSSTPPGGGVHGMCGFNASQKVLKDHFRDLKK